MLAGAHYMQHSHNMAQYCRVLAHRLVRDMRDKQKWLPIMQLLMAYAMNPYEDLQPFGTSRGIWMVLASCMTRCRAHTPRHW